MKRKTILTILGTSSIGGDGVMFLMGIPFLMKNGFRILSVTIPIGQTTEELERISPDKIVKLSMGSKNSYHGEVNIFRQLISFFYAILRVSYEIFTESIDYIYTLDRTSGVYIAYITSILTGRNLVLNAQHFHYLGNSKIHNLLVKRAIKITVASDFVRQKFVAHGIPSEKLVRIFNAIDVSGYDPCKDGSYFRKEINVPEEAPVILLPGRLNPYKGQDTLLLAAPSVLARYPNACFVFAGGGAEYLPQLTKLVDQLGITAHVHFVGHRPDLPAVTAASTIITMPSFEEPFGIVAIEAMAMKKPLISTTSGGVPEFITDHVDGVLVPPKDPAALANAIIKLLNNKELAINLATNGRKKVIENFDKSIYGEKIVKVFQEIKSHKKQEI